MPPLKRRFGEAEQPLANAARDGDVVASALRTTVIVVIIFAQGEE